ncbi:unnamed protein product [Jaminaea pallidilutea]
MWPRLLQSANASVRFTPLTRSLHSTRPALMAIEESMRAKLNQEFKPQDMKIRNDSAKHAHHAAMVAQGGGSGETHFYIEITSSAFEGKTQIARHRAINALLADEFGSGLHALSLRTRTPAEAAKTTS